MVVVVVVVVVLVDELDEEVEDVVAEELVLELVVVVVLVTSAQPLTNDAANRSMLAKQIIICQVLIFFMISPLFEPSLTL